MITTAFLVGFGLAYWLGRRDGRSAGRRELAFKALDITAAEARAERSPKRQELN